MDVQLNHSIRDCLPTHSIIMRPSTYSNKRCPLQTIRTRQSSQSARSNRFSWIANFNKNGASFHRNRNAEAGTNSEQLLPGTLKARPSTKFVIYKQPTTTERTNTFQYFTEARYLLLFQTGNGTSKVQFRALLDAIGCVCLLRSQLGVTNFSVFIGPLLGLFLWKANDSASNGNFVETETFLYLFIFVQILGPKINYLENSQVFELKTFSGLQADWTGQCQDAGK